MSENIPWLSFFLLANWGERSGDLKRRGTLARKATGRSTRKPGGTYVWSGGIQNFYEISIHIGCMYGIFSSMKTIYGLYIFSAFTIKTNQLTNCRQIYLPYMDTMRDTHEIITKPLAKVSIPSNAQKGLAKLPPNWGVYKNVYLVYIEDSLINSILYLFYWVEMQRLICTEFTCKAWLVFWKYCFGYDMIPCLGFNGYMHFRRIYVCVVQKWILPVYWTGSQVSRTSYHLISKSSLKSHAQEGCPTKGQKKLSCKKLCLICRWTFQVNPG